MNQKDKSCFFREVNTEFLVHELKNPISVIETNIRVLIEKTSSMALLSDREQRTLRRVLRNARNARNMLHTLLEVGRAESFCFNHRAFKPILNVRRMVLEAVEAADADLFDAVKRLNGFTAQFHHLSLEGIRMEAQPVTESIEMTGDDVKFNQIVANLLRNALYYRRRRLLVMVSLHRDSLTVAVRDDGPGIAPEHQEAVFQRYKQAHPDPGVARNGHGLGLGVSRILARAMGGDLAVESQLGQGAVFRLTLPLSFQAPA